MCPNPVFLNENTLKPFSEAAASFCCVPQVLWREAAIATTSGASPSKARTSGNYRLCTHIYYS